MAGGTAGDDDLRSRGLSYGWYQNGLGTGPPLDVVSVEALGQRLATGKKVQPQLAGAHARLSVHVLGVLNHAMGEHQPNRDSTTPNSLLRAIKLWYPMPALLYSPDGRIKRRQRFALAKSVGIVLLLPWLMAYTKQGDSSQRDAAQESRRRRSSNGLRRRAATQEGSKWQHATSWQSHAQLETRRPGTRWWPCFPHGGGCSTSERQRFRRWIYSPVAPG